MTVMLRVVPGGNGVVVRLELVHGVLRLSVHPVVALVALVQRGVGSRRRVRNVFFHHV